MNRAIPLLRTPCPALACRYPTSPPAPVSTKMPASPGSASTARSTRAVDRQIADLKSQIERREKQSNALSEDLSKSRDKIQNLLVTIDELQSCDSTAQLAAKRAERELRDERENRMRLERELEGWKVRSVWPPGCEAGCHMVLCRSH